MWDGDVIQYDIDAIKQDAEKLTKENAEFLSATLWIEINRLQENLKKIKKGGD